MGVARHRNGWRAIVFPTGNPKTPIADRKLSVVVQLSEPDRYQGGDLQLERFVHPNPEELRSRGAMIVFPSILFHRVTPITKGERSSLVGWMEGPHWR